MKKYKIYIKFDNDNQIEMIIGEKNKESDIKKIEDFFLKLNNKKILEINAVEVYYNGNNYIEMEN